MRSKHEQTGREILACSLLVELQKALQSQNGTSSPEAQTNVVTASSKQKLLVTRIMAVPFLKNSQLSDLFISVSSRLLLGVSKLEDERNKCKHVQTHLQRMERNLSAHHRRLRCCSAGQASFESTLTDMKPEVTFSQKHDSDNMRKIIRWCVCVYEDN